MAKTVAHKIVLIALFTFAGVNLNAQSPIVKGFSIDSYDEKQTILATVGNTIFMSCSNSMIDGDSTTNEYYIARLDLNLKLINVEFWDSIEPGNLHYFEGDTVVFSSWFTSWNNGQITIADTTGKLKSITNIENMIIGGVVKNDGGNYIVHGRNALTSDLKLIEINDSGIILDSIEASGLSLIGEGTFNYTDTSILATGLGKLYHFTLSGDTVWSWHYEELMTGTLPLDQLSIDSLGNIYLTGRFDLDVTAPIDSSGLVISKISPKGEHVSSKLVHYPYFDFGGVFFPYIHNDTLLLIGEMFEPGGVWPTDSRMALLTLDSNLTLIDAGYVINDLGNQFAFSQNYSVNKVIQGNGFCYSTSSWFENGQIQDNHMKYTLTDFAICLNYSSIIDSVDIKNLSVSDSILAEVLTINSYSPSSNVPTSTITGTVSLSEVTFCNPNEVSDFGYPPDFYLTIFPNPSTSELNYRISDLNVSKIELTDINGRVVRSIPNNQFTGSISTSDLNSGIYILKAISPFGVISQKWIKL